MPSMQKRVRNRLEALADSRAVTGTATTLVARHIRTLHERTRWEYDGQEALKDHLASGQPVIMALWHGRLCMSAQGWDPERYRSLGVWWVVRSHYIKYLKPSFEGQAVVVCTWVFNFKRSSSVRKYRFERGEDVLAVAETNWALIDMHDRVPARIPPELRQSFEIVDM